MLESLGAGNNLVGLLNNQKNVDINTTVKEILDIICNLEES